MRIDEQDVRYVAGLARLEFSEAELQEWAADLSRILLHWAKLNEVDTTGVLPTAHVQKASNRFREDTVKPSLHRVDALQNASAVKDGCFKVPQIIE